LMNLLAFTWIKLKVNKMKELNNFREFLNEEQVNEGKVKDFLLKTLLKTTDVVSPDTLKYVYSELVKQVGEDKVNEAFQELGLDPSKYLNENKVEPQTELIGIAAHALKDMKPYEAIDAIDRLMLYLKDKKADLKSIYPGDSRYVPRETPGVDWNKLK